MFIVAVVALGVDWAREDVLNCQSLSSCWRLWGCLRLEEDYPGHVTQPSHTICSRLLIVSTQRGLPEAREISGGAGASSLWQQVPALHVRENSTDQCSFMYYSWDTSTCILTSTCLYLPCRFSQNGCECRYTEVTLSVKSVKEEWSGLSTLQPVLSPLFHKSVNFGRAKCFTFAREINPKFQGCIQFWLECTSKLSAEF